MMVQNMNKRLKRGDIVRLKMPLFWSGWKGAGVVVDHDRHSDLVRFLRLQTAYPVICTCVRREVSKMRRPSSELVDIANKVLSEYK
jgi:hypothetical protein